MPSLDHPSVGAVTPGSFGRRALGINPYRNYKIAHQKVSLDVDFENNAISGYTDIIVIPNDSILKSVKLDCRNLEVTNILVNSRRAKFNYNDPFKQEFLEFTHQAKNDPVLNDAHQHHFYKNRNASLFTGEDTEELTISMPDKLKLSLQDPSAINIITPSFKDSPGSFKASTASEMIYSPVTIKIEYKLRNPKTGLHFVGGKNSNIPKSDWHVYTTNSVFGASTSSWVPCVDNLWEKPTWEVEISVPQTLKDIGISKIIGSNYELDQSNQDDDDDEEEDSTDILVIGGDFSNQKENAHPVDLAKKLVTFSIFNPTSPHHIGWAAGPFIQRSLLNLKEEEDSGNNDEKDTTAIPSSIYCLPSQERDALNTTVFLYKAIDYYSREFGSFPFTSNALIFVSDLDVKYSGFAGLTILNKKLLYRPNEIEPIYKSTYSLSVALSEQWSGINVVPKSYDDLWITIGIAHFMAQQFIKKLMGVNEYKYRIKKQADLICDEDIGKRPLAEPFLKYPVSAHDLEFITLKSPIVLFILDRRMTKTDKSFGLSRVIPKIFLQAMSGDLANGSLSTEHFQHVCEKVNHNRLDSFFRQWVYGSGVPIFRVTQRFNKKRMFIEMGIRQVQLKETQPKKLSPETFISDAKVQIESGGLHIPQTLFTGPMTIRIHEADGTPYEHIVDLKEGFTKLDIQYNTKYKRLKRSQKQIKTEKEQREAAEEDDNVLLHCLGDNLQTEKEIQDWELTEWTKEQEDRMTNEAFEWIRVDADFEWICKIHINQPDYMYASQLQQDRDVEAQVESITYFANSNPSPLYSTILLRTLMDPRYYFGVRVEAAHGMAKFAKEQVNWIGSKHLLMAFKELFCFPNSTIPLPNNFQEFPLYYIRKAIPLALSTIKDSLNNCPLKIKKILLNILKYNQNLDNPYSDSYYIGHLIHCLVNSLVANPLIDNPSKLSDKDRIFLDEAVAEISRHQKLEEWTPSTNSGSVSSVALKEKIRLSRAGLYKFDPEDLLNHTKSQFTYDTRVFAFEALFSMGALKNEAILKYFFLLLTFDQSLYFKHRLITTFTTSFGHAVIDGASIDLDEHELTKEISLNVKGNSSNDDGLFVVEDGAQNQFDSRRDAAARTTSRGATSILRRDYSDFKPLKDELWSAVRQPLFSVLEKRDLYEILEVLIPAYDEFFVKFDTPRERKIKASNLGDNKVLLKRVAPFKLTIMKKPSLSFSTTIKPKLNKIKSSVSLAIAVPPTNKYKSEINRSKTGPLRYVSISKTKRTILVSSDPLKRSRRESTNVNRPIEIAEEPAKPKIKLKLKFGS